MGDMEFAPLPHAQDTSWAVLQFPVRGERATEDGEDGELWNVRIIPSLDAEAFTAAKLKPSRANLRSSKAGEAGTMMMADDG